MNPVPPTSVAGPMRAAGPVATPATAPAAAPVAPVGASVRGPVPAYSYDLTLDPAARNLKGTGSITVTNTEAAPLDKVVLRLWANTPYLARSGGKAAVTNFSVDGTATDVQSDRSVVTIPLAKPLATGESAKLDFNVDVTVPSNMGRTGTARDGTLYFGNALPLVAVRDDEGWNLDPYVVAGESFYNLSADWKVRVAAPTDVQLITTGSVANEQVSGNVRSTEFDAPHVRDFIVVAAKGYQQLSQQVGDTKVNVWAPAGDTRTAQRMLQVATGSLDFYNKRYGTYDMPEYDVVATRNLGGGMEYPGVTLNDAGFQQDEVVAHETGHQWFYGMAGNNEWDDPFLDESITSFITSEYMHKSTDEIAKALEPGYLAQRRRATAAGIGGPGNDDPDPNVDVHLTSPMNVQQQGSYFSTIYSKAPRVIDQLKHEIGEDAFVRGMRAHFERSRNGIQTAREWMDTMSAAAGRDLTPWFNQNKIFADEPSANDHLDPNTST